MKTEINTDMLARFRAAFERSDSAYDCFLSIPSVTAQEADVLDAAVRNGMLFADNDFDCYVRGEIREEELTRSACDHLGFTEEMKAEAETFYNSGRLPVSSEVFTVASHMLRSKEDGNAQIDHLAAAFYAAYVDHETTKDTVQAAQAIGYCIALQASAAEHAAKKNTHYTDLDEFIHDNEEEIIVAVFVAVCILTELITAGLSIWLALNGLATALTCVCVFGALSCGALALSESYENGVIRNHIDSKIISENSQKTVDHILAQHGIQMTDPLPENEYYVHEEYDEYTDNEDIWPNLI